MNHDTFLPTTFRQIKMLPAWPADHSNIRRAAGSVEQMKIRVR